MIGRLLVWPSAGVVTFYDVQRHFVRGAIGAGSRLAVSFVGVGMGVTEAGMSERKGAGAQRKRCLTQWSLDSRLRGNDVVCGGNEVM